jgi:EAL domain-containing protein (putative c-di-GMP-specific phosphodiesterase class I)
MAQVEFMHHRHPAEDHLAVPYLEHFPEGGEGAHRLLLERFPFTIGRGSSTHYCINSRHVSKEHAEIVQVEGQVFIRDLGSTNGTFVNGQRVREAPLFHGDIVHVAHKEFRFGHEAAAALSTTGELALTAHADGPLPSSAIRNAQFLREMLRGQSVKAVFQPIVDLRSQALLGYEALGRGTHDKLSPSPVDLFGVAAQCNLATELSRLFRQLAVQEAVRLPPATHLFLNLHPAELRDESLLPSLQGVPAAVADRRVVLEFHEEAVAETAAMGRLRGQLHAMGISLAYDDFGAGQARLTELADVPPDFIKLDKALIHDIHQSHARQELVRALARVSTDLGIRLIAEGIEVAEEIDVCLDLGCQFGQGYFFGHPQSVQTITGQEETVRGVPQ